MFVLNIQNDLKLKAKGSLTSLTYSDIYMNIHCLDLNTNIIEHILKSNQIVQKYS